ncbi:hypothetical protein M752DRAFT_275087 [Aspergillus phoenicis ATCC 13157]|uniref:Uncharacterized protein n=1 Tax=Aspergillus phoenicis ATCC 13157 TaxID=1353007 RepID=A0A370PNN2_ASPPH|nr:hypothetical protein M752DRAFT_275087 [Aspergillus phoenicis ATCC 13157]
MVSVGSPPARCAIYFNGDGSMSPISDRYYIDTIRVGIYSSPISICSNLAFKWGFLA